MVRSLADRTFQPRFGGTGGWKVPPSQTGETSITGGLIASPGVRTRDITAPTIIFVEAESTAETSITITLQLSEPGTVYCEAYTSTGTPAVKTDCNRSQRTLESTQTEKQQVSEMKKDAKKT